MKNFPTNCSQSDVDDFYGESTCLGKVCDKHDIPFEDGKCIECADESNLAWAIEHFRKARAK